MAKEWIKNYKHWIFLTGSWMCLFFFIFTFMNGLWHDIDCAVYAYFLSIRQPVLTFLIKIMTYLGSAGFVIVLCLVGIVMKKSLGLILSFHMVILALINFVMKNIVMRPRPAYFPIIQEYGYSFPSFHAMMSMSLYGFIAYKLWKSHRLLAIVILTIPIIVGITRIYLGVHYASDVVAGWLISLCYLSVLYFIHKNPSIS